MEEIVIIDRVGGLANYRLLREDARLFDLFMIALQGEADAQRIARLESEAKNRAAKSRGR